MEGIKRPGTPRPRKELGHGISVRPSGLFPSALLRPRGSFSAGIPARMRPRQINSLRFACLATLQGPWEQQSRWAPLALTNVPHWHSWGLQMFTPSLRPTATLLLLLLVVVTILLGRSFIVSRIADESLLK